ncbi:MAG: hypothetical protein ACRD5E_10555 [Nitrososphaeraceae archaeon]
MTSAIFQKQFLSNGADLRIGGGVRSITKRRVWTGDLITMIWYR